MELLILKNQIAIMRFLIATVTPAASGDREVGLNLLHAQLLETEAAFKAWAKVNVSQP